MTSLFLSTFQGIFIISERGLQTMRTTSCHQPISSPWYPAILSLWPPSLHSWLPQSPVTAELANQHHCSLSASQPWLRFSVQRMQLLVCAAHLGWHRAPSRQEICLLWEMCVNSNYHLVSLMSQKFKYKVDFMQSRLSRMFSEQTAVSLCKIEETGALLLSSHRWP